MPTHSVPQRWRAPVALIVLALLFACLKGRSPTDATANDARFDLHAQVSGGSVLHITVVYLDQSTTVQSLIPVMLLDQRITVAAGTQSLPLTIDLTRCLADPLHVSGPTCDLEAGVVLEQNGQAVDSVGVGPVSVTPGQTVHDSTSLVAVGHVDIYPTSASIAVGATTQLFDTVFSPTNVILTGVTTSWSSANTSIATVNASGLVKGVAAGTTTVTAAAGGQTSPAATITVTSVGVGRVVVYPTSASLTVGAITVLSDSVYSANNTYLPNATVTWASANPSIATVNTSGAVTGVAAGTTTVTASAGGQTSNAATITVTSTGGIGTIVLSTPVVTFTTPAGGALPARAPIRVTSLDTTVVISGLSPTITYTAGQPTGWLIANVSDSVTQLLGQRVRAGQIRTRASGSGIVTPAVLDMVPNTTNLPAGTYTANVTVSGTNATSASVNVTYTLTPPTPVLAITPNPVFFSQYAYGSTLAPLQTVTASNSGSGTLGPLSAIGTILYTGADTGWITVAAASATTATGQPKTTFLHLGSDTASIPISAIGATNNPVTLKAIVSTYVTYSKVVLGATFGCGLTTAATVYCWGGSGQGELGDGGPDLAVRTPVRANIPYSPTNPVIDIEAGSNHACALLQSGTVFCWGQNTHGQVGNGSTTSPVTQPTQILGHTYGQITLGALHTCAIEGTPPLAGANYVDCWGDNSSGQFGNNLPTSTPQTTPLVTPLIYYTISAGDQYTCGINNKTNGSLFCWGVNNYGQLGIGSQSVSYTTPQLVTLALGAGPPPVPASVTTGYVTTCATDVAGNGYCWGNNSHGEVGNGTTSLTAVVSPTPIAGSYSWTSISAGLTSVCGIASTGQYCWGDQNYGQLGNGTTSNSGTGTPGQVLGGGAGVLFTEFTVGQSSQSACYITGGSVSCFGFDSNGQLGDGGVVTAVNTATPVAMTAQPAPSGVGPSRVVPKPPTVRRQVRK